MNCAMSPALSRLLNRANTLVSEPAIPRRLACSAVQLTSHVNQGLQEHPQPFVKQRQPLLKALCHPSTLSCSRFRRGMVTRWRQVCRSEKVRWVRLLRGSDRLNFAPWVSQLGRL